MLLRPRSALTRALALLVLTGGGDMLAASESAIDRSIRCEIYDDDSTYPADRQQTLALAIEAIATGRAQAEKEDRKCYFRMAEALARHLLFEDPGNPEARYWYAAAMALRANDEGGRTQVQLAKSAHEQSLLALSLVPDHAGAHYIVGRLHAAVMRLSRVKRFVATKILGGSALSAASWETAESHLAAAARLDPGVPEYHYELGALYLDTGRPELALAAFEEVIACPRVHPTDGALQAMAEERAARLRRQLTD